MDRNGRKRVFEENLEILANGKYTTPNGREIELKCEAPDYYDEPFELEEEPPVENGTLFTVANEDCVESFKALLRSGYHPALLNMASASHPGGGVENGSGHPSFPLRAWLIHRLTKTVFCSRKSRNGPRIRFGPSSGLRWSIAMTPWSWVHWAAVPLVILRHRLPNSFTKYLRKPNSRISSRKWCLQSLRTATR